MELYQQNSQFVLAEKICRRLREKGFQALLAGGCVRDFLLGREPHDFDVATNASPEMVEESFEKTVAVGKSFGVIMVVEGDCQVEVATFRKDGPYVDGRRPESVEFSTATEDAQRRDFTVNGLFYDPENQKILDFVEGQADLRKKEIRAIGDPGRRFEEDHLRLLRAVRFASQLGFQIEARTWNEVVQNANWIRTVSGERIQDELGKLLMGAFSEQGLKLLFESGLLRQLLGEEKLMWKSTHAIFSRREGSPEDLWFRFFFWIRGISPTGASIYFFEALCDKWRFSRDLKQKSLRALQWTFEKEPFLKHPLGELLSFSYEPEHLRGLLEYSETFLVEAEKPVFEKFKQRRRELGGAKPKPWVTAADLSYQFQGEELGRALRMCFWEQLEGQVPTKADLLKRRGL